MKLSLAPVALITALNAEPAVADPVSNVSELKEACSTFTDRGIDFNVASETFTAKNLEMRYAPYTDENRYQNPYGAWQAMAEVQAAIANIAGSKLTSVNFENKDLPLWQGQGFRMTFSDETVPTVLFDATEVGHFQIRVSNALATATETREAALPAIEYLFNPPLHCESSFSS